MIQIRRALNGENLVFDRFRNERRRKFALPNDFQWFLIHPIKLLEMNEFKS